ncbi:MAG TPA: mechanosensitive ion channel family protein [Burkholderiaceae bacterium]|nr:mechanosensitive ion channel family protein [Burkholderiaceae bacterium]
MKQWWLETTVLSIPLWNWVMMLAAVTGVLFVLLWIRSHLRARLAKKNAQDHLAVGGLFLRVVASTNFLALFALSVLLGVKLLELPVGWSIAIARLWFIAVVIQVAAWANTAINFMLQRYRERHPTTNQVALTLIGYALRTVLWAVAALAILDNLGVNITAFVASLGIGGVAVALAAQVVLGDLFASAAIGLDKPFEVGDFIVVGNIAGSIEYVGLKTTRIRSLGGEQIVCSNTELLKQTIQNYKRMDLRRIAFKFVVAYGATAEQIQTITAAVRAHIERMEQAKFDRAHLLQFAERGLEFEVVYYVLSADYNVYMDIQQDINLAIMNVVHAQGLEFGRGEMRVHYPDGPDRL